MRAMIAGLWLLLLLLVPGAADAMSMVESRPTGGATVEGDGIEFFVRFDTPVDHRQSALLIEQDGKTVEALHPRLDSAPTVLFARAGHLSAGSYELRWVVRSLTDGAVTEGTIPFSVKSK